MRFDRLDEMASLPCALPRCIHCKRTQQRVAAVTLDPDATNDNAVFLDDEEIRQVGRSDVGKR